MKKLLAFGVIFCITSGAIPQTSLQTTITTGFAFPVSSNKINSAYNGNAMHYGSHLDFLTDGSNFRFGIGSYAGQILSLNAGNYKATAQQIADKYRLPSDRFRFSESAFRSSAFLIGPVAGMQSNELVFNLWAKGGYSLNEPGRFSATLQDAGATSNVLVNQAGTNKNSFACNLGGGLNYRVNEFVSIQLAASYFDTKTELVNYNYDREKGTTPMNFTAHNSFVQAVLGLNFGLNERRSSKSYINRKDKDIINNRYVVKSDGIIYDALSNNKSDRKRINNEDTIIFEPQTIELRQVSSGTFNGNQLQASNNYLTGFLYRTANGVEVSQCSGQKRPGDPIPGLDVRLKNTDNYQTYNVRTNEDGSFSVKNIEEGIYQAATNTDTAFFAVNNKTENADYRLVNEESGECGIPGNNIILVEGKMYAEVQTAREAGSGMATGRTTPRDVSTGQATGKRTHRPMTVINTDFDLNYNNIVKVDGLLYAEIRTAREAGSGMASGKRTVIHGDVDGDGLEDRLIAKTSANQNGQVLRGYYSPPQIGDEVILVENSDDDQLNYHVVQPRDVASGQSSGKISRQQIDELIEEGANVYVYGPRDAASGQASGKRSYQPRDVASGQATGKRSYQPRDAATGQATGKRTHHPLRWANDPYLEDAQRWATDPYVDNAMFIMEGSGGKEIKFIVPLVLWADNISLPTNTNDPVQSVIRATKSRSNVQNNRKATKSRSNIQNNRMAGNSLETTDQPSAIINTSRSNIKNQRLGSGSQDNAIDQNIDVLAVERIHCSNGACKINAVVSVHGTQYNAVISGVLKTKHDIAKNAIGNIR